MGAVRQSGIAVDKKNLDGQRGGHCSTVDTVVAVAVCKHSNSMHALKWALDNLMCGGGHGEIIMQLVHVRPPIVTIPTPMGNYIPIAHVCDDAVAAYMQKVESQTDEMLRPFWQLCNSKQVKTEIVVLEDDNVSFAILKHISNFSIKKLVLGSSSRNVITRKLKGPDMPSIVAIKAPNFCTVYVISKGRLASVCPRFSLAPQNGISEHGSNHSSCSSKDKNLSAELAGERASEPGATTAFHSQHLLCQRKQALSYVNQNITCSKSNRLNRVLNADNPISRPRFIGMDMHESQCPLTSQSSGILDAIEYSESSRSSLSRSSGTISQEPCPFSSNDSEVDREGQSGDTVTMFNSHKPNQNSNNSGIDNRNRELGSKDFGVSPASKQIQICASSSGSLPGIETELERLKLQLRHTQDMYSTAFKEAVAAKKKAESLNAQLIEEARRLEAAKEREKQARVLAAESKAKCKEAMKAAEGARETAEREEQHRRDAELRAIKESDERKKVQDALQLVGQRYRKYSIEEIKSATDMFSESLKIGEGGYGPVFKCNLDHTTVAIKVPRSDAAQGQGRDAFQQEVEVLSRIHHPHIVLLLGACPERGCLVYEYMANGSLEDRLFCRGGTSPLPWFTRFRIASETASALLFLHNSKPAPIVHRDLKPANILLDHNLVSKIGDAGLAKLVPSTVSCSITEYKNTLLAGTFCYIDPEYQRTGTLRPKSDLYALGIVLLQLLTAKPPMGLTNTVEMAIENGSFKDVLDKAVEDWPPVETLELAKLALKCTELRCRDRPDLESIVLPELQRLKAFANAYICPGKANGGLIPSSHIFCPVFQVCPACCETDPV